ncbi:MAG: CobD/CbiB family protein [Pseudomonadota bacterium]
MSLLALVAALLMEQFHPLSSRKYLSAGLAGYADFFEHRFNGGKYAHGRIAWWVAILPLLLGVVLLTVWLHHLHPLLALLLDVLVLYLTMGFRRFSHYFTDIHQALRNGQLERARGLLGQWRGAPADGLNGEEVVRVSIEEALLASHRNVFGVIVWFVLFSAMGLGGAAGALLYRLVQLLHLRWSKPADAGTENFGGFAGRAYYVFNWLPVRATAMTFAIVGDFENTIYCWRTQAASWADPEAGILLASGAGALGVMLGMPLGEDGELQDRPELGVGDDDADIGFMQSTIGLMWRAIVFWVLLLLLLTAASLLG